MLERTEIKYSLCACSCRYKVRPLIGNPWVLPGELHTMADSKRRTANEENSSDEEDDRKDPKLRWHVPEVICIADSEKEGETESHRSCLLYTSPSPRD